MTRTRVPKAPRRWAAVAWLLPGLLWMVSSTGSGSVLFTPRVGSRYGYELLWAALVVFVFMWVMIREVGRYTVVTGKTILEGYHEVPGPRGWAVWLVLVPGLVAGVSVVAGVAALAGSALALALPGSQALWGSVVLVVSAVFVLAGRYGLVETVAAVMSVVLVIGALATAVAVAPDLADLGGGAVPGFPDDLEWSFVMPWVGFLLAGSGGILWFSYWVTARGYGAPADEREDSDADSDTEEDVSSDPDETHRRLKGWTALMSRAALLGVATGGLVIVAFMVLGAELLGPEGIIPEGIDVAEDLARLMSDVWGQAGHWFLIISIIVALWGTVVSNQDGWPRTFADAIRLVQREGSGGGRWRERLRDQMFLRRVATVVVVTLAPLIVLWAVRDPVTILDVGGIITAIHTPVFIVLTLIVNRRSVPKDLRAGWPITVLMVLAGVFYLGFGLFFFADLFGVPIPL